MFRDHMYRRRFLEQLGIGTLGAIAAGSFPMRDLRAEPAPEKAWEPVSDRKIRFGIVRTSCYFLLIYQYG